VEVGLCGVEAEVEREGRWVEGGWRGGVVEVMWRRVVLEAMWTG